MLLERKDIFLVDGYEAVSYLRELQCCLSSVCFLVLLKKKVLLVLQMWNLSSDYNDESRNGDL